MLQGSTPQHVICALVVLWVYSKLNRYCPHKFDTRLHWFTFMCIYLSYLLVLAIRSMLNDVLLVSGGLDPARTENLVRLSMAEDQETNMEEWQEEASLNRHPALRLLVLSSPLWVLATFMVVFYHIHLHTKVMHGCIGTRRARSLRFRLHDKTIRILLLPAVYGLMSLHGVVYMCGVVCNVNETKHFSSWVMRRHYYIAMFKSAFYVGDIYESFALLMLGNLIMNVLQLKVEAPGSILGGKAVAEATAGGGADCSRARSASFISTTDVMREMKELTTFGIKFFCWTCGLQGLYQLSCAVLGYYHWWDSVFGLGDEFQRKGFFHQKETAEKAEYFFLGAGFVASFAAIGNIMKVESAFHIHLAEFCPFWKFWGTKMLVSIAFLQSMALVVIPPFCWWTQTRVNLFYASLLCLECLVVSLVHLHAWGHDQTWYLGADPLSPRENDAGREEDDDSACDGPASTSSEQDNDESSFTSHDAGASRQLVLASGNLG